MHRERLPSRMTVAEFQEKFEQLEPGEQFIYHTGLLGEDRQHHNDLDKVAELALRMGTDLGLHIDPPDYVKWRASKVGTGVAILVQRRNCSGHEYLILKRRH